MGNALKSYIDRGDEPVVTDEQLKALSRSARQGDQFSTRDVRAINATSAEIKEQIAFACKEGVFSKGQSEFFLSKLGKIATVDQDEMESFKKEIEKIYQEMVKLKVRYRELIDKANLSQTEKELQWQNFLNLSNDERKEKVEETMEGILRVSEENFQKADEILSLPYLFNEDEKSDYREKLYDSTSAEYSNILQELWRDADERKKQIKSYKATVEQFGQLCPPPDVFYALSYKEREDVLGKISDRLVQKYILLQDNHAYSQDIAPDSKKLSVEYVKGLDLVSDNGDFDKIKALQSLPKQLEKAREDNRKNFDRPLDELMELATTDKAKNAVEARRKKFYAGSFNLRQQLIQQLENDLKHARETSEQVARYTKSYLAKLDVALEKHIINERTHQRCKESWSNRPVREKAMIDRDFDGLVAERVIVLRNFDEVLGKLLKSKILIADEVTEKKEEFYDMNQYQRVTEVVALKKLLLENKISAQKDDVSENATGEDNDNVEYDQESVEIADRIADLTSQATKAERRRDWQEALESYQAILALDTKDPVALGRLPFVTKKLELQDIVNSADEVDAEDAGDVVEDNTKAILDEAKAKDIVMLEEFVRLASIAENSNNGSWHAEDRDAHLSPFDREVAKELAQFDSSVILRSDGTAEEKITVNFNGEVLNADTVEVGQLLSYLRGVKHVGGYNALVEGASAVELTDNKGQAVRSAGVLKSLNEKKQSFIDNVIGSNPSSAHKDVQRRKAQKLLDEQLEKVQEKMSA